MTVRLRAAALVAGLAILSLSACSSSDDQSTSTSSVTASTADTGTEVLPPEQTETTSAGTELPSAPAPATTEVPAPGGGDISETVTPGDITSNAPVALSETGTYANGVTVQLVSLEPITTKAELPGEIAGPGLKVTVKITNGSADAIDVGNVVVDLQDAVQTPAIPMTSGAAPFTGSVAAGADATGVYIFTTPTDYTDPATITVTYSAAQPVAVFVGNVQ
jgi:hypothetical protein